MNKYSLGKELEKVFFFELNNFFCVLYVLSNLFVSC